MSYLTELRAKSKQSIEVLSKQIDDSKKTSYGDDRLWKLTVDKLGNGEAVLRFLPPFAGESVSWVEKWSHGFEGTSGKWFMEGCPTTIKGECPICNSNRHIWKTNVEEVARKKTERTKRNHKYYSNVLVVDDPSNPDNNGKVFLFEYGPKIFAKIFEAIQPISVREKPSNPFDPDNGRNFILLAKSVSGQRNYDSSKFESPSAISDDDAKVDEILASTYSLDALIAPESFKSFKELTEIYDRVNGTTTVSYETELEEEESEEDYTPSAPSKKKKELASSELDLNELPF